MLPKLLKLLKIANALRISNLHNSGFLKSNTTTVDTTFYTMCIFLTHIKATRFTGLLIIQPV